MVGAAIALVIGAVLVTMMLTGGKLWSSSEASVEAQEEARRALTNMSRELREAGPGSVTSGANQLNFDVILGFNMPGCGSPLGTGVCRGARDSAGNPQPGWSVRYTYQVSPANRLVRQVLNAASAPQITQVLATRVTGATFTPSGSPVNVVTVTLTTQAQESGGVQHRVLNATTRISLRNAP